ncbi:uroporphyrinogen decarboxylase family protein [Pelolinea submarina]|uniref:Uroporphyrinogen decarboxylase n=1 Tax=Pelolinea submarina TaxID=913107 RepID=A0A347ZV33_9CHLR|nr:uroporphyrinogen decarboxylase family protein [Pelolinea submarina]REG10250.1 uroporphyrinogen decarboxylase [Pelolinea submarina]BBB49164.1 uroporphyrinogen decarboxylase [Pelolinea submarina]
MGMTSRERVQAVLNHEVPDRVPIIIGVSNATGIKMKPYRALKEKLGIQAPDDYIYDWPELGSAKVDEETMQRLHGDARGVLDRFPRDVQERNRTRDPHAPCIDDWGIGQTEIEPGVWFPGYHPLADATTFEDLENYPNWPKMDDPYRVAQAAEDAKRLAEENEYAILATPWLMFPFERAFGLQGMDKFLMNMAMYPDFAEAMLKKNLEFCMQHMSHFLDAVGDNIDMIKIGDDLGSQDRLMISPRMYRKLLKPIHAELIALIKSKTKAKVFFHTDGDVFDLIGDFIEIGVDVLNPIQTSAGKMADLEGLKREYGKDLVFCGAVDTQHILPHGTPEEVRQEMKRVIDILGQDGGYMVASVHTIMNEVPPENILAMVDATLEFGTYPLK